MLILRLLLSARMPLVGRFNVYIMMRLGVQVEPARTRNSVSPPASPFSPLVGRLVVVAAEA